MERFAVKSKSFALYEAFKKEAERMGYKYDYGFNDFCEDQMDGFNCLFFSDQFTRQFGTPSFSFSNTDRTKEFELPNDWNCAIDFAKKTIVNQTSLILNNEYTAILNYTNRTVTVGCQVFSFEKISKLHDMLNQGEGFERSVATKAK